LTYLGYKDTPAHEDPARWTPLAIAGRDVSQNQVCVSCHRPGGSGNPIAETRARKDPEWLISHVRDPQVIAPGLRQPPDGAGLGFSQAQAIVAYMRKVRAGGGEPTVTPDEHAAALVLGSYCAVCHMIDGEGGSSAPDLTRAGSTRDAQWLREWITDPTAVDPFANMPAFGGVLTPEQLTAIVNYLAARK
jgi:mono/diheme cytochrome c family protein